MLPRLLAFFLDVFFVLFFLFLSACVKPELQWERLDEIKLLSVALSFHYYFTNMIKLSAMYHESLAVAGLKQLRMGPRWKASETLDHFTFDPRTYDFAA